MSYKFAKGNTQVKMLAGLVLLGLASAASAQSSILVGGGATLPAVGYGGTVTNRLIAPPTKGSLLFAYTNLAGAGNPKTSYCQTGSGTGKTVLEGNQPMVANVNADCVAEPTPPPTPPLTIGFGATSEGETLTQPHFIGSDSPLAQSDYTAYQSGHSSGQPVQIPAVSGAIAIAFNKAGVSALNLTENQVCQIFSGQIKTWNDPALASAGVPAGVSGNINIVYRSDGSGTSFNFSNHLSAVCGAKSIGGLGIATAFQTNQTYTTAAAAYLSSYAASQGASGNPAVVTAVLATDGSIGYAETANALSGGAKFAAVSNLSAPATFVNPGTYGGTALPVNVVYNQVISNTNDSNGRPVLVAITPTLTTQCIALVNPSDFAVPSSGYPILAVSYLLANSAGNGTDLAHVRGLMFAPYNASIRSAVTKIGANSGLSFLTNADMTSTKINGCITN